MIDRRQFIASAALLGGCATVPVGGARRSSVVDATEEACFRYFWELGDPATGLVPDRWPTPSFASIAAVGFGLTGYGIGVVRGWVSRAEARKRTLATLTFFAEAPQGPQASGAAGHKGFFYHFLDMRTGRRFARNELSTIDTTLLLGGVLFAAGFFDADDADERAIRTLADQLVNAPDWRWITPRKPFVSMGWHPETGFIPSDWDIYNESLLLYLLALGSEAHPLPAETWDAWTARFEPSWGRHWGEPHIGFAPLFGHQYSHAWVDFRGIRDRYMRGKGIDYFENSRRATIAQRNYAIANPKRHRGYGADVWGITACDGPGDFVREIDGVRREFHSYSARGPGEREDGTLAPTAAGGSIAFAPEICVPALETMHARYGRGLWGKYGFLDSFNPTLTDAAAPLQHGRVVPGIGWVDGDWLGIDQGAMLLGIANWKDDLVWRVMRRSPVIVRGLKRAGFSGGWLEAA